MDDGYVRVPNDPEFRKLLEVIFDDKFMKENTTLENFEAFKYSSAVITNWNADTLVYARILLDGFVRESTRFNTWEEMVMAATDAKFGSQK